jgi:ABC-type bacteriocin/lantibiotic exporter with double-glycine peptidase domain
MRTEANYRAADFESDWEASVLARALELAADAADTTVSADAAWRAASEYAADNRAWHDVAASAAQMLGLQPHLLSARPSGLPGDRPALVRTGAGCWLVVVGRSGRKIRVVQLTERGENRSSMTPRQLAEVSDGQPWLLLQPLLALDSLSAHLHPHLQGSPWRRLRAFLALERRELWVAVVYAVVIGGLTLATPIAVQALVNTVAFGSVLQPLVVLTILLLAVLAFAGVLNVLEAYVVEVIQRRAFVRVADDFGRRIPSVKAETLDRQYGPELVNRFFDVLTVQKSLSTLLLDGLSLALQTAIGMLLLGFYHPLLLAFDVALVVMLLVVLALGRGAVATGLRESAAKYRTAAWLEDLSRSVHMFRGTAAQRIAADRTAMLCRDYLSARKSHFRILVRQIAGGVGLQIISMVALLGVGGWLVLDRQLTLGQLVAAELVIAAMATGFVKLGKNLEKIYDLNVGVLKIAKVVDLPTDRRGGEPLPVGGPASVVLRDVTVSRGSRTLVQAASLEIAPGEDVLVTGPAGAGKSTFVDVVSGLREASSGSVQIDGFDLRRVDLASVRDRVELVRGVDFVEGSVMDNIRMHAHGDLDERATRELLRLVGLEEAIDGLPEGLDTPLLPSGAPLSERQARRLALVRALGCRPRILILDRALDGLGLDRDQKERLLDRIFDREGSPTLLVVSDDPEVMSRCSRTVRLEAGRLEVLQ